MINLRFTSDALPDDTFQILELEGEEEISRLFRFELRLISRDPDIDFKQALAGQASLSITNQGETRHVHGMLAEFEQGNAWHGGLYEYRAVLVPRLWTMTQSVQNQIYQNETVPEIVHGELNNIQSKGSHPLVANGLLESDYEIHTISTYEDREYVVQYKESDFNFISRLMEHEGIYYYFDHDGPAEKMVITDILIMQDNADREPVRYQVDTASSAHASNIAHKFSRLQKHIPGRLLLNDYNDRMPHVQLQTDEAVDPDGIGFVTEYGAHFKTPDEGQKLATIRAEELRCRQNLYSGESYISRIGCGHIFTLTNHFRDAYNQNYMMTKIVHHASQSIESWGKVGNTSYHNHFTCIPANLQYRPQRLTPKPKLYGVMNGVIDSEQDMNRADIDEEGRYKVLMPFDISGAAPGRGSRRIRMAQPYGGQGAGMSFPLVKGTEVIWTCIDGDIDRPIITGTVPNPLNPSVTTADNHSSNVIKTMSGITMGFHDGSGGGGGQNSTGGGPGGGLARQQAYQNIDLPPDILEESKLPDSAPAGPKVPLQQQQQFGLSLSSTWQAGQDISETDTNFQILVPYENETKKSYLRMGASSNNEQVDGDQISDGWLSYVDGTRTEVTKGDVNRHHHGIVSDFYHTEQFGFASDTQYSVFGGHTYDATLGMVGEFHAGGKSSSTLGIDVSFTSGISYEFGYAHKYSMVGGTEFTISDKIDQEASKKVHIKVDPDSEGTPDKFMEKGSAIVAASLATVATIPLAVTAGQEGSGGERDNNALKATAISQYGISAIMAGIATAHWLKKRSDKPATELFMDGKTARLKSRGYKSPCKVEMVAANGVGDKKQTKLKLTRSDTDAGIELAVHESKGKMKFKVGGTSIEIKEESIVFECAGETFTFNKDGLSLKEKDLKILKGNVEAKKGAIESKSGKIKDKLEAKDVKTRALKG